MFDTGKVTGTLAQDQKWLRPFLYITTNIDGGGTTAHIQAGVLRYALNSRFIINLPANLNPSGRSDISYAREWSGTAERPDQWLILRYANLAELVVSYVIRTESFYKAIFAIITSDSQYDGRLFKFVMIGRKYIHFNYWNFSDDGTIRDPNAIKSLLDCINDGLEPDGIEKLTADGSDPDWGGYYFAPIKITQVDRNGVLATSTWYDIDLVYKCLNCGTKNKIGLVCESCAKLNVHYCYRCQTSMTATSIGYVDNILHRDYCNSCSLLFAECNNCKRMFENDLSMRSYAKKILKLCSTCRTTMLIKCCSICGRVVDPEYQHKPINSKIVCPACYGSRIAPLIESADSDDDVLSAFGGALVDKDTTIKPGLCIDSINSRRTNAGGMVPSKLIPYIGVVSHPVEIIYVVNKYDKIKSLFECRIDFSPSAFNKFMEKYKDDIQFFGTCYILEFQYEEIHVTNTARDGTIGVQGHKLLADDKNIRFLADIIRNTINEE